MSPVPFAAFYRPYKHIALITKHWRRPLRKQAGQKKGKSPLDLERLVKRLLEDVQPTRKFLAAMAMAIPSSRMARNICAAEEGDRVLVSPDGVLAMLAGVPLKKIIGVYEINPEIFGLSEKSLGWRQFLQIRNRWDLGEISWEDAIREMTAYLPARIPRYSPDIPVLADGVENRE